MTTLTTGFSSDLSWKVFLDHYAQKDLARNFQVGDLTIATTKPHPKWSKKDVARVTSIDDSILTLEPLTGLKKGDVIERRAQDRDRRGFMPCFGKNQDEFCEPTHAGFRVREGIAPVSRKNDRFCNAPSQRIANRRNPHRSCCKILSQNLMFQN